MTDNNWINGTELYQAIGMVKAINQAIREGEYPKHISQGEINFITDLAVRVSKFGSDTCISCFQQSIIQQLATKIYMYRIEQVYS
ncbi:MAG: hypothetical protein PHP57_06410 [Sideroxydans sp.]|nr:hypothetical protein [Sideroxydans sp.]